MKILIKSVSLPIILLMWVLLLGAFSSKNESADPEPVSGNIIIVGFNQNLNSNYYSKSMIASKMGMGIERLDTLVSNLFIKEIESVRNSRLQFVYPSDDQRYANLIEQISYIGADDEIYSDLTDVNSDNLNQLLVKYNSEYIICFSQYFFKRQEKPFPTLFHIINYTIYNQNKEELAKGKVFTNTFDLVDLTEFESLLKKNAKKYISSIEKELN